MILRALKRWLGKRPPWVETEITKVVEVSALELPEDAVLVLKVPGPLSRDAHKRMEEYAKHAFRHQQVVILEDGMSMDVVVKPNHAEPGKRQCSDCTG